jgi:hypothetical protein
VDATPNSIKISVSLTTHSDKPSSSTPSISLELRTRWPSRAAGRPWRRCSSSPSWWRRPRTAATTTATSGAPTARTTPPARRCARRRAAPSTRSMPPPALRPAKPPASLEFQFLRFLGRAMVVDHITLHRKAAPFIPSSSF